MIRLPAGNRRHDQQPETVAGFMERGILIVVAQTHKIVAALLDEHGVPPLSVFRHSVANERIFHVAVGAVEKSPDAVQVEAVFRKFNGADAEFFLHGVDRFAIVGHGEDCGITDRRLRRPEGGVCDLRLEPERVIRIGADLHRIAFCFKDTRAVRGGNLQFHGDLIRLFCQLEDLKAAGGRHLVDHMTAGRDLCGTVWIQLFRPQEHAAAGRNGNCQRIGDVDRLPHVEFCVPVKPAVVTEVHGRDGLTGRHIPGVGVIQTDLNEVFILQIICQRDEKFLISAEMGEVIFAVHINFRPLHGGTDLKGNDLAFPLFRRGETVLINRLPHLRFYDRLRLHKNAVRERNVLPIDTIAGKFPIGYTRDDLVHKSSIVDSFSDRKNWCTEQDLNLHALRHWNLNPTRLPFRHQCAASVIYHRIHKIKGGKRKKLKNPA